jgi:translation elongation factor EF-1beta
VRPIITVNVEKYQVFLDDSGLSEKQKEEFLQALWTIIVAFVDLGFGVHPLQEVCGQNENTGIQRVKDAFDEVESENSQKLKQLVDSGPPGGLGAE